MTELFKEAIPNRTANYLKYLADEVKYAELLDILALFYEQNPDYTYSNIKQSIENHLNNSVPLTVALKQAIIIFINNLKRGKPEILFVIACGIANAKKTTLTQKENDRIINPSKQNLMNLDLTLDLPTGDFAHLAGPFKEAKEAYENKLGDAGEKVRKLVELVLQSDLLEKDKEDIEDLFAKMEKAVLKFNNQKTATNLSNVFEKIEEILNLIDPVINEENIFVFDKESTLQDDFEKVLEKCPRPSKKGEEQTKYDNAKQKVQAAIDKALNYKGKNQKELDELTAKAQAGIKKFEETFTDDFDF
jgi:hypothetical protein